MDEMDFCVIKNSCPYIHRALRSLTKGFPCAQGSVSGRLILLLRRGRGRQTGSLSLLKLNIFENFGQYLS